MATNTKSPKEAKKMATPKPIKKYIVTPRTEENDANSHCVLANGIAYTVHFDKPSVLPEVVKNNLNNATVVKSRKNEKGDLETYLAPRFIISLAE